VRPINLLLALACTVPMAPAVVHETLRAEKRVVPVQLEQVIAAPSSSRTTR